MNDSLLNDPAVSGRCLFPQTRSVAAPFFVDVPHGRLACFRQMTHPDGMTVVYFHGNGEAVADYVPGIADLFSEMGLNSLFVEYPEYGTSTGRAQLVTMLGDGELAVTAAELQPEKMIVFGRSLGSLYATELVHRQPGAAGLVLESGIACLMDAFPVLADLTVDGFEQEAVAADVHRHFDQESKLSGYGRSVLILHTEHDGLINVTHAERNYGWSGALQKRLLKFPYGNHNTILRANAVSYLEAIKSFAESL